MFELHELYCLYKSERPCYLSAMLNKKNALNYLMLPLQQMLLSEKAGEVDTKMVVVNQDVFFKKTKSNSPDQYQIFSIPIVICRPIYIFYG